MVMLMLTGCSCSGSCREADQTTEPADTASVDADWPGKPPEVDAGWLPEVAVDACWEPSAATQLELQYDAMSPDRFEPPDRSRGAVDSGRVQ